MTRTFAVSLTIPDNEAFTALEALGRLGIDTSRVVRADIWIFEGELDAGLAAKIGSIETIHNPNKHRLTERQADRPESGEVWIAPRDEARARARDFLNRYPKAAYMSAVESWRELPGGEIEFTMRRFASAD